MHHNRYLQSKRLMLSSYVGRESVPTVNGVVVVDIVVTEKRHWPSTTEKGLVIKTRSVFFHT